METHLQKSSEVIIPVLEHGKYTLAVVALPCSALRLKSQLATGLIRPIITWSALETHQEKSSEVIIRVLEHGRLHVGSGRTSVLNSMITIAISHGPI